MDLWGEMNQPQELRGIHKHAEEDDAQALLKH